MGKGLVFMDKGVPVEQGSSTLSEHRSKKILAKFGIPTVREELVSCPSGVLEALSLIHI